MDTLLTTSIPFSIDCCHFPTVAPTLYPPFIAQAVQALKYEDTVPTPPKRRGDVTDSRRSGYKQVVVRRLPRHQSLSPQWAHWAPPVGSPQESLEMGLPSARVLRLRDCDGRIVWAFPPRQSSRRSVACGEHILYHLHEQWKEGCLPGCTKGVRKSGRGTRI